MDIIKELEKLAELINSYTSKNMKLKNKIFNDVN